MNAQKLNNVMVTANDKVAKDHFLMEFEMENSVSVKAGQFVNVSLPASDHLVPRPFSIWSVSGNKVCILYKIFGEGTRILSEVRVGDTLTVLMPLGNSFPEFSEPKKISLICGGIGIVPVYFYAWQSISQSNRIPHEITLYYGASSEDGLVMRNDLKSLGIECHYSTDDGSFGFKGNSLALFREEYLKNKQSDVIFACGPKPFMKAVGKLSKEIGVPAFLAEEEVMGCGFGACVGCVIPVIDSDGLKKHKLVCVDGPVFNSASIDWDHY